MNKKYLLLMPAIAVMTLSLAAPVAFAQEGSDDTVSTTSDKPITTAQTEAEKIEARKRLEVQKKLAAEQREKVELAAKEAREAAKQKAEAAKAEIKTKLEGERSKRCSERETKVNQIVANSSTRGKANLARFQAFQQKVEAFVTDKNLTVDNYQAMLATVNEKQAAAAAAVEAAGVVTFKCADQDASNVGGAVSSAVSAKNQALKDYRDALKTLVSAVKTAYEATKSADDSSAANQ